MRSPNRPLAVGAAVVAAIVLVGVGTSVTMFGVSGPEEATQVEGDAEGAASRPPQPSNEAEGAPAEDGAADEGAAESDGAAPDGGSAPDVPTADPSTAPLTREPEDRTAFALAARERTVTVFCERAQSLGSGWPIRAESLGAVSPGSETLIVTNAHVVDGCQGGTVGIQVGERLATGRVIGFDLFETETGGRDLALITVDLDIEPFEVSSDVQVGHWVMAVGSPSGLDGTVTFGYVANDRDGVLIFDAAISPGNSGGPLINARGEVIGTNTWLLDEFGSLSMALRVDVLCVRLLTCR